MLRRKFSNLAAAFGLIATLGSIVLAASADARPRTICTRGIAGVWHCR